jgi:hypothetical protein
MSGWVTIWDVASEPFRWGNAGEGLGAVALLALGGAAGGALRASRRASAALVLGVSCALAAALVWTSLEHQRSHAACVAASLHGDGRVLEGEVSDYRPLTSYWQRPAAESFTLAGELVRLPLVAQGCGYHRTTLERGPLRDGLRVRLRSWNGQILRVEIDRDALLGMANSRAAR